MIITSLPIIANFQDLLANSEPIDEEEAVLMKAIDLEIAKVIVLANQNGEALFTIKVVKP